MSNDMSETDKARLRSQSHGSSSLDLLLLCWFILKVLNNKTKKKIIIFFEYTFGKQKIFLRKLQQAQNYFIFGLVLRNHIYKEKIKIKYE